MSKRDSPHMRAFSMKRFYALLLATSIPATCWPVHGAAAQQAAVPTYHGRADRSGNFVVPGLTREKARSLHLDRGFHASVSGHVYAQPLYWRVPGASSGMLLVATEENKVFALDAASGKEIWQRAVGKAVARSALGCGNINPLGITGTPVIDELGEADADLGGTNPIPLDLPAASGTQAIVLALGKDRHAYLLDRNDLGGIGGSLVAEIVAKNAIRTAPAAYPAVDGVFVAFQGAGAHCPKPGTENGLTVLNIRAGAPPSIATAWCGALRGAGAPIVTTTDGRSDSIVWIVGAEGDNRLHGFAGDTGEPLFTGGGSQEAMAGVRRFQTLIAAEDRLYVAADGRVYAFGF